MTKSNHTVTIGKVLMDWLDEKDLGVDRMFFDLIYKEDSPHKYEFEISVDTGITMEYYEFEFTQSDLEANDDRKNEALRIGQLGMFIRAELERQCNVQKI